MATPAEWNWNKTLHAKSAQELEEYLDAGCPWNVDASENAAKQGNIAMLEVVLRRGLSFHPLCLRAAANDGRLEAMQWLSRHASDMNFGDGGILLVALKNRHWGCAEMALQHGCPFDGSAICTAALHEPETSLPLLRKWRSACCSPPAVVRTMLLLSFSHTKNKELFVQASNGWWNAGNTEEKSHPTSASYAALCMSSFAGLSHQWNRMQECMDIDASGFLASNPDAPWEMTHGVLVLARCAENGWLDQVDAVMDEIAAFSDMCTDAFKHAVLCAACAHGYVHALQYFHTQRGWQPTDHTPFQAALEEQHAHCIEFCMIHQFPVSPDLWYGAGLAGVPACEYLIDRGCRMTTSANPLQGLLETQPVDVIRNWLISMQATGTTWEGTDFARWLYVTTPNSGTVQQKLDCLKAFRIQLPPSKILHPVVQQGDIAMIWKLHAEFGWRPQSWGNLPVLKWAVEAEHADVVESILASGYRPEQRHCGVEGIIAAAASKHCGHRVLQLLHTHDVPIYLTRNSFLTALKWVNLELLECVESLRPITKPGLAEAMQEYKWEACCALQGMEWVMSYLHRWYGLDVSPEMCTAAWGQVRSTQSSSHQLAQYAWIRSYMPEYFTMMTHEIQEPQGQTLIWAMRHLGYTLQWQDLPAFIMVTPPEQGTDKVMTHLEPYLRSAKEHGVSDIMKACIDANYNHAISAIEQWWLAQGNDMHTLYTEGLVLESFTDRGDLEAVLRVKNAGFVTVNDICESFGTVSYNGALNVVPYFLSNHEDVLIPQVIESDSSVAMQVCLDYGFTASADHVLQCMKAGSRWCLEVLIRNGVQWDERACFIPDWIGQNDCLAVIHAACEGGECPRTGGRNPQKPPVQRVPGQNDPRDWEDPVQLVKSAMAKALRCMISDSTANPAPRPSVKQFTTETLTSAAVDDEEESATETVCYFKTRLEPRERTAGFFMDSIIQ